MIKVNVTKKDISKARKMIRMGGKASCDNCPIALALKRTQKKSVKVYKSDEIYINERTYYCKKDSSSIVNRFIDSFDAEIEVSPIKFDIYPQ